MTMTPEQFKALLAAVRGLIFHHYAESTLLDVNTEKAIMLHCVADQAHKEAIETARKLLVVEAPKEIGMHVHVTEITGVAGAGTRTSDLPCEQCNWGHK